MKLTGKSKWVILIGILPALLIYIVFSIVPILQAFYYSVMEWDGLTEMKYVGLDNFITILKDSVFWNSLKNNIYVVFASVFGQISIALFVAILLNRKIKGAKFFRTIGFMPVVLSTVVIGLMWNLIYDSKSGLLNGVLSIIGLEDLAQNWLGNPKIAMIAVCITIIWQFVGQYLIIFLAALQNVSAEVLEAAEIDGATEWTTTWKITIPMIWETIVVAVILCISGSLRTFDLIYVMTHGGPSHSTDVMALYMYDSTFQNLQYGYGSAVSVLIFVFSLGLIFLVTRVMGRKMI